MNKVAINGLGRIGRAVLKILIDTPDLELVAMNDLQPADNLAYLLKYDSVYGRYDLPVQVGPNHLSIGEKKLRLFGKQDPSELPWHELAVDIVFECTGVFRRREQMQQHLKAGAKHVILSAPEKSGDVATVVHGVNRPDGNPDLISCASCTTNCITPVVEVLGRRIGVRKATMTTIHAYTSSQSIVDGPKNKWRRGRAGAANLVPTSTGAAKATAKALPQYDGIFDGVAVRAPVAVGSIVDIVAVTERRTDKEEINAIFREEAGSQRYEGILGVCEDPIVSSDIIQDTRASIVDLTMTQVVDGDLIKVMSWYDNEWGYSAQMVREARRMARLPT
ncbi:type I glyceraldehyde-3-phosphate dehydrogenase [Desulfatitalea alkaliphila]|uniref:Glyceraldehyde-3-phosphate dehydrogenase n=1 Tax=Desulfatitalea alkaliphila TaxID=2929485 RepID=A0AA41QYU9_9BACT|nr:type I glyceraldehyde-3-phosphate dehydrogenase [Desulfatitalea alkaliphila]MCJ8499008.1 type I glyceraldehyde-3-phosphate dehydrogenase [Desulfatitalea alkaliphila]